MSIFNKVTKTFQWGQHTVKMETGEVARQAGGAVLLDMEGTVVLATVVGSKIAKAGQDFFPLTVDYIEKTYAAGKIPGSFFKREAKPSEHETLTSRLIDRVLCRVLSMTCPSGCCSRPRRPSRRRRSSSRRCRWVEPVGRQQWGWGCSVGMLDERSF